MTIYDKLETLHKAATFKDAQRVVAELRFASEMSKHNNGKYHKLVSNAADVLYQAYEEQGALTKSVLNECEQLLLPLSEEAKTYTLHCVAHAHIDMNWMFGYNETVAVTLETFRTMLRLMEEYPEFTFSQSQISVYKIVEEYDHDMFAQIKKRVAEGRWEISSTTWVETDKNMPSGESLTRHYLYSKKYLRDAFKLREDAMLLDFEPDTFGHSENVPEVLSKAGVRYYYHCRGYDGHIIYRWRAPSGAEVLVYREPDWYISKITADMFEKVPSFASEAGSRDLLKVYGVGDHGGGPSRKDISMLLEIAAWPIAPKIVFSSYHQYFKAIEPLRDTFPVVNGELNFVFTGCFSSQSKIKMANRIAEDQLFQAEYLTAAANAFAGGGRYNTQYEQAWQRVLFNQFHDILPGSGIADTREYAMGMFQQAMGYVHSGMSKALNAFAQRIDSSGIGLSEVVPEEYAEGAGVGYQADMGSAYRFQPAGRTEGDTRIFHLFNTTAYVRHGVTEITVWDWMDDTDRIQIRTADGKALAYQLVEKGDYWLHKFVRMMIECEIPAFGYITVVLFKKFHDRMCIAQNKEPRVDAYPHNILENARIRAEFDYVNMTLVSLTDKTTGRQLVQKGACSFELQLCSTLGGGLPSAWNAGVVGKRENLNLTHQVSVTKREQGKDKLSQWIDYVIRFCNSSINVRVKLDQDDAYLRFLVNCDWHEKGISEEQIPTLRFYVPLGYKVESYRYEIPFGTIERHDVRDDVCSRGFVFADSHDQQGVAVMTNSLYGYCGSDDCIRVTLIRSSVWPDPCPEYGMHHFELGVGACNSDMDAQYEMVSAFLNPVQVITNGVHDGVLPLSDSLMSVKGGVQVSAVKLPENEEGLMIRVYNPKSGPVQATLRFAAAVKSAALADGLENVTEPLTPKGDTVSFTVNSNEVQAVRVKLL